MQLFTTIEAATASRWAVCLFIATLAGYVSLDHAKHLQHARGRAAAVWLSAAALALGTGVWSSLMIELGSFAILGRSLSLHGGLVFLAWLSGSVLALIALGLGAWRTPRTGRMAAGAIALGIVIAVTQTVALSAIVRDEARPIASGWQLMSLLIALAGALLVGWLCARTRTSRRRHARLLQVAAAASFAVIVWASQRAGIAALGLPEAAINDPSGVGADALALLASVGSLALLAVMWISATLETQMKAALLRSRQALQLQASSDLLTGLPNRQMFEAHLAQACTRADGDRKQLAMLYLGLDGFKPINQALGHNGGDLVLREISGRIRSLTRNGDLAARLGGDEFLILIDNDPRPEQVMEIARQLLSIVGQPFLVGERNTSLSCSIGIAMYPQHGMQDTMIHHAGAAMRSAKTGGGNAHCLFEPRMVSDAHERNELLQDLRRALSRGEFELHYQPKVDAPSGQVTGVEALMRWNHPTRGMVSPTLFIPIAERYGLINALGDWVIDEACRQAAAWRAQGLRMRVAVNLSAHQLRQEGLADHVAKCLAKHHINATLLTCELTESAAMEDAALTRRVFERLARLGVHISIDDFGTGYSSLSHLRQLPAEELKIDRSFVFDLAASSDARAVVDAVIRLAHALGLKVVAEGVETEQQYELLRSLGCDELQGFLFAKPMPARSMGLWAMGDNGPRTMGFRASLFSETQPADVH